MSADFGGGGKISWFVGATPVFQLDKKFPVFKVRRPKVLKDKFSNNLIALNHSYRNLGGQVILAKNSFHICT